MELNNFVNALLVENVKVVGDTKDFMGNNFIDLIVTFPSGKTYKETYKTSPYIIRKFYARLKHSPLKAYHYLKKIAIQEESNEII